MLVRWAGLPLVAAIAIALSPGAFADDEAEALLARSDDVDWGEYLAGECVTCHAVDAADGADVPRIHGADAAYVARALLDYRSGVRTNTTMGNVATALGDDEMAALAHHLAEAGAPAGKLIDSDGEARTDDPVGSGDTVSDPEGSVDVEVGIRADVPHVIVQTMDGDRTIERIQDTSNVIDGEFARTSRPCPPFCIQPIRPVEGVETIGELELIALLEDDEAMVVDSREIDWYLDGTIPGAVHVPYTELASRLDELGCTRADDAWRCENAVTVALFCNGPWCGQSPAAIRAMAREGYPVERIRYYRGGMQVWRLLGLSVVEGDF